MPTPAEDRLADHLLECSDRARTIDETLREHEALPGIERVRLVLGEDKVVRGV